MEDLLSLCKKWGHVSKRPSIRMKFRVFLQIMGAYEQSEPNSNESDFL